MATNQRRVWSNLPVSPGSVLKEEIEYRGISEKELADHMGRPIQVVNDIVLGKKAITKTTANQLQTALGISAQFWLNLENSYQVTLAKQEAHAPSTVPVQDDSA